MYEQALFTLLAVQCKKLNEKSCKNNYNIFFIYKQLYL